MYFKILFTWVHLPIKENKNYLYGLLVYITKHYSRIRHIYCIGDCLIDPMFNIDLHKKHSLIYVIDQCN